MRDLLWDIGDWVLWGVQILTLICVGFAASACPVILWQIRSDIARLEASGCRCRHESPDAARRERPRLLREPSE
jgi:hypothetical protein